MKFTTASLLALVPSIALAQRPANTSICDYYTNALFGNNTGASQYMLLTALVNTGVIGNWTANAANVKVNGILAPGMYNGVPVNLLPYFDGSLKSTNRSGVATSVNFLDGGGAAPLMMGMPSNDPNSNQQRLLTHLYEFFGALLGCSNYGMTGFPAYAGNTNMYAVHGFMALGPNAMGYFIQEVGLAAASFGVAPADIQAAATALNTLFNYRCLAPTAILPMAPVEPQSMCIVPSCPLAPNNTCSAYPATVPQPKFVNGTVFMPAGANSSSTAMASGSSSMMPTGASSTAPAMATTNAAAGMTAEFKVASLVFGILGFLAL